MIDVILNKSVFTQNPYMLLEKFARERNLHFTEWTMWDNGTCHLVQFESKKDADDFLNFIGFTNQLSKDPHILRVEKKKDHSVIIGRRTYVPYKFAYDEKLNEYVWKFCRGDAEAGTSVS